MLPVADAPIDPVEEVAAAGAELWEVDRTTSAGRISIPASPERIYEIATDYADWRSVFSDVLAVEVIESGREDALVRFKSKALEHTTTIRFGNTPNAIVAFTLVEGPPGAVSTGRYVLTPAGDGTTTLSAELYMEVTGLSGLFISDARVRKMRRAKLRADLEDLAAYFAPAASSTR